MRKNYDQLIRTIRNRIKFIYGFDPNIIKENTTRNKETNVMKREREK